jgi:hypothetical protein
VLIDNHAVILFVTTLHSSPGLVHSDEREAFGAPWSLPYPEHEQPEHTKKTLLYTREKSPMQGNS